MYGSYTFQVINNIRIECPNRCGIGSNKVL